MDRSQYLLSERGAGIKFPFDKKKIQYTIREVIIIYNWISGRKSQASRKTWESLGNEGILYCRSRESLKNFWKNWRKYPVEEWIDKLSVKEARYSHNYANPIFPHEELPQKKPKSKPINKLKRTKEQIAAEILKDTEVVDTTNEDESNKKKRFIKRKLKKMELEGAPSSNIESAGVPNNDNSRSLEINPVTVWEQFDESEEPNGKEDEKESIGDHSKVRLYLKNVPNSASFTNGCY